MVYDDKIDDKDGVKIEYGTKTKEDAAEREVRSVERILAYMERLQQYIRVRDVDKETLSDLVIKCKGPRRSIRQFAAEVGVNASTLTRIINMQTASACKNELLAKIADNADPDCGVTLEMLLDAQGLEKLPEDTEGVKRNNPLAEMAAKAEKRMRQVLLDALLSKGYDARYSLETGTHRSRFDVLIETPAVRGNGRWAVEFKISSRDVAGTGATTRWMDHIMAELYKGALDIDKVSIVVEQRAMFEQIKDILGVYPLPDEFSVILIGNNSVVDEFIAPMRGTQAVSIFK